MQIRFNLIILYFSLSLLACSGQPSDPICRVDENYRVPVSSNAGCIIRLDNKLVVTSLYPSGKFNIPIGENNGNETAQCAAHRNTWELTGFNVEVGKFVSQSDSGYLLFSCDLKAGYNGETERIDVPDWASARVSHLEFIEPFATDSKDWLQPDNMIAIRDGYVKALLIDSSKDDK